MTSAPSALPLSAVKASPTNPRKRFPEAVHAELTASVAKHGVMQPVLVRPWPEVSGLYEIVAGERRFRAATAAGLPEIPVLCKALSDDEVLHIQIIENLQRQDLHALDEADGYQSLVDRGHTTSQIAEEVSRTPSYVTQRLKLCSLVESARKLFFDGKLAAGTALIVARLPVDLQEKAAKTISEPHWGGDTMSAKSASDYVQREFMLRLDQAPFKTSDGELVPAAGACGPCPKRTGNQVDLFGDVKSKEVCTDPACYAKKREAAASNKRAEAIAAGRTVISGKEAKKVKPQEYSSELSGGWVSMETPCYDDAKHRTYRQIIGKGAPTAVLEDPYSGTLVDVIQQSDLKKLLAEKGIKAPARGAVSPSEAEAKAKKKREDAYRGRLFDLTRAIAPAKLDDVELHIVACAFYERLWHENQKRLAKLYGWVKAPAYREIGAQIKAMTSGELAHFILDMAVINDTVVASYSDRGPELLEALATNGGIDLKLTRKQVDAELKAKATPKSKLTVQKKIAPTKPAPAAKKAPAKKSAAKRTPAQPDSESIAKVSPAAPPSAKFAGAAWPFPTGRI